MSDQGTFRERHFRERIASLVLSYEDGLARQVERKLQLESLVQTLEDRIRVLEGELAALRDEQENAVEEKQRDPEA